MTTPLRVLILEDNASDAELMLAALRGAGFDPASERVEAESEFRDGLRAGIDVVLADFSLPQFDALGALDILRESGLDIPFIVVSGTIGEERAVQIMQRGASDYIVKDRMGRLGQAVGQCIELRGNRSAQKLERVRTEESLRRSEQRYRTLVAATAAIVWDSPASGQFDSDQPAWTAFTGQTVEQHRGWGWLNAIHPDDRDKSALAWEAAVRSGNNYLIEHRILRADGEYRHMSARAVPILEWNGAIREWVGIHTDVTEQRRVEDERVDLLALLTLQIARMPMAYTLTDANNRYRRWNPAAERTFGFNQSDILGKHPFELIVPPQSQPFVANILARLAAGDMDANGFCENVTRDGRTIVCEWHNTPLFGNDGLFQGVLSLARDVTDRKRAEQRQNTQHAVVSILADAPNLSEAAPRLLRAICEATGWDAGDLWVVNRTANVLSHVAIWHVEGLPATPFGDLSRHLSFVIGECLPGRCWASKKTSWIVDVSTDPDFRRSDAAAAAGLRGGFAFPILFGDEVLAVAEFFSRESRPPDAELLRTFEILGSQIGQFLGRKRVEAGLHLFRALIDQTTDGIEVIDPKTGRFLDVNEKVCTAHGYTREEYLDLSVSDLDPFFESQSWGEMNETGQLSGFQSRESLHRRKDGSTFPVEINFNTIHLERDYMVAVVRDITDRKRNEEAVRSHQQRLQHVLASSPAVLFTLTVAGGQIRGINWISDNLLEMYGYTPDDAFEAGWWIDNLHPEDRERAPSQVQSALFERGHACHEYRFRHRDGKYRWTRGELKLIRDASGFPVEVVGSWSDITERKQIEEQFRQSQKMESIGQLAGGVAHDFNNLLTIINGYSELLLQGLSPSDPTREFVSEILKAGERSSGLTRQLLAFSRNQVLAPRVLDLNVVVVDTEKMLRRLIGEDVRLSTALDPELAAVRADPGQIEQVLMNLAVNARDAMPGGGRLTIETSNVELDHSYTRSQTDARAGPYVLIAVTDSGTGMSEEVKSRIFEPFYTTKGPGAGTGLGLATVYGIVKQSGGHVTVHSELGVGTAFKVYLPRVEEAVGRPKVRSGIHTPPRGTETVLVVEDEDGVRALTCHILAGCGYAVLEAVEATEAYRIADAHVGRIHLLITDVVMPGPGGRAVAERLAVGFPGIRVLFVSGYTDDAVIQHGVLREGMNFLQKPFSPFSLAIKVRQVLDAGEKWTTTEIGGACPSPERIERAETYGRQ